MEKRGTKRLEEETSKCITCAQQGSNLLATRPPATYRIDEEEEIEETRRKQPKK
jgi:hypothetical protein